jgi:hypothetical protein
MYRSGIVTQRSKVAKKQRTFETTDDKDNKDIILLDLTRVSSVSSLVSYILCSFAPLLLCVKKSVNLSPCRIHHCQPSVVFMLIPPASGKGKYSLHPISSPASLR